MEVERFIDSLRTGTKEWPARDILSLNVKVWARHGAAGLGPAGYGSAGRLWCGQFWQWRVERGGAWQVPAGSGRAVETRSGWVGLG